MGSKFHTQNPRPHAVCIPFPAQGHINPMFKLAKLLHHKGFHITFVNTEFNHRRLLNSRGRDSLNGVPSFRFETIPDGLPPSDADATQDAPSLCDSTKRTCLAPFQELLSRLNNTALSKVPPVTCILSDCIMSFTLKASKELHIPNVLFWAASACSFMAFVHYIHLIEKGLFPLKDWSYLTSEYMDTVIDWIPGMEGITLKYLPSFIRTTDPDDIMVHFVIGEVFENARNASALIFNTFDDLEHEILEALPSIYPPIYTIGPLQLVVGNQLKAAETPLSAMGSNLWKEQTECLEWLDSKEQNSVLYVNFGSVTVMTEKQLVEFAWGLANSKRYFLWVVRPDLVIDETAIVPQEFVEETKDRGLLVAGWCPQERVLNHTAVGGFLTHSGWNSTTESLCGGVPMICWPFFADQQTNCWFCDTKWGIGMEINSHADRVQIEKKVRELMEGERGKLMKNKVMEWKSLAENAATAPHGSSFLNLDKMINQVLLASLDDTD